LSIVLLGVGAASPNAARAAILAYPETRSIPTAGFLALGNYQEDVHLTLKCRVPSMKKRRPDLVFNGTCAMSDGSILRLSLSKAEEAESDRAIVARSVDVGCGAVELSGKKFDYDTEIDGPGKYRVTVSLVPDLQEKEKIEELKRKIGSMNTWTFDFAVWDSDLVGTLAPILDELRALAAKGRDFIGKCETASKAPQGAAQRKAILGEGKQLLSRLDSHKSKTIYPAAWSGIYFAVRAANANVANGAWNPLPSGVEYSLEVGNRELCLWVLKDLRRVAGKITPELSMVLKSLSNAPGIGPWLARLEKATPAELDDLEIEIRGTKIIDRK
jgi:hypothetical protein